MVSRTSADDQSVIDNTCGIFGEEALPGRVNTVLEETPLTAVCMTANGEINIGFLDVRYVVFGMMTKQNAELLG